MRRSDSWFIKLAYYFIYINLYIKYFVKTVNNFFAVVVIMIVNS